MGNLIQAKEIIGLPNSTLVKTALNASGSAPIYACRAWVNFNGTGTVAISASGNVSSITDNGVGAYAVNFTTAMPDSSYGASGLSNMTAGNITVINVTTYTKNSLILYTYNVISGVTVDRETVNVSIFR